jgi:hypothetical protein
MNKYLSIGILFLLALSVGELLYFNAKLEGKDTRIKLEKERVETLNKEKSELENEVQRLIKVTQVQDVDYAKSIAAFEAYKAKVSSIKPISAPSIKPIIKEVPAEVVILKANETSNEILNSINDSADNFKRLPNN